MDLTEEDFLNAIASEEAFLQTIIAKPQGWYSLFYREKDRLLHRIRQNQALSTGAQTHGSRDQQVIALAAEHARLEQVNDLISQAAALSGTTPKAQDVIGNNKAQRVLGGEAPRSPRPSHRKSLSWQDQSGACHAQEESSETDSEKEEERLAKDLAEARRMIAGNLRRLVKNESPPPMNRRRSRTMDSSPKADSSPKVVRFNVPDSRRDSEVSGISHSSGTSNSSGSSHASGGSQASGTSYGSASSYASDREVSTKAKKMLGIGPKRKP